eukprot:4989701-Prymnesium_polylepis.2
MHQLIAFESGCETCIIQCGLWCLDPSADALLMYRHDWYGTPSGATPSRVDHAAFSTHSTRSHGSKTRISRA